MPGGSFTLVSNTRPTSSRYPTARQVREGRESPSAAPERPMPIHNLTSLFEQSSKVLSARTMPGEVPALILATLFIPSRYATTRQVRDHGDRQANLLRPILRPISQPHFPIPATSIGFIGLSFVMGGSHPLLPYINSTPSRYHSV
jgi:hypothetical protein